MNIVKKMNNKWKSLSPVGKASMALVFAKFFQKGMSMITGPIFTRIMPQAEYGIISTFTSWQSVIYIIATLNMASGVFNNGMIDFKDDRDDFVFSLMTLANSCTLILFVFYLIFRIQINNWMELPSILIYVMFAYFFVTPAFNYWMGRKRFEYDYIKVTGTIIGSSILSTLIAIVAVILVIDSEKATAKVLATESVSIALGVFFCIYTVFKSSKKINFDYWKYALKINLPLIPHYLSMYVLASSDRIMISKMVNVSATAIYNVAYTVASIMMIFWNAVDASYAPWIYQRMDEKKYSAIRKRGNQVLLVFASMSLLATLFAPEIIAVLAPASYREGIYIVPAVSAATYFTACYSLYMRVELYLKKSKAVMIGTCASALLNLGLNYVFIQVIGYTAAAYTTLICYALLAIFHAINLKRLKASVYDNGFILGLSGLVILMAVGVSIVYSHTVIRYTFILIIMGILVVKRNSIIGLIKKGEKR